MFELETPDTDDLDALASIEGRAFGFTAEEARTWLAGAGAENLRVVRSGGEVAGGLLYVPMGQFVGGRSVGCMGYAGVAVHEAHRRTGVATALMRRSLQQVREAGYPIAALYPSTTALYRRAGFEQAGSAWKAVFPIARVGVRDDDLEVRQLADTDEREVETLYTATAANGNLDRRAYIWDRVRETPRAPKYLFGVFDGTSLEGFVRYSQPRDGRDYRIGVADIAVSSHRAARRLWTFFADHGTTASTVTLAIPPTHPMIAVLPHPTVTLTLADLWMVRIVDVVAALEARGYASGLAGRLELEVEDDLLPNGGRWVVDVENGRASVARGGSGGLRLDVRGLAAMFTGHLSGREAQAAGLVDGDAATVDLAGALFSAPPPWMADHF